MHNAVRAFLALARLPVSLSLAAQASDDPAWLSECQARGTDTIECLSTHLETLEADQENDLIVLHTSLDVEGPDGTDFAAARELLDTAQADWENFVHSDCRMLDVVMGDFGGMGGEPLYCLIEHYETRNAQIARWIARVE